MIVAALGLQSYIQHISLKTEIVREREKIMQTATNEWMSGGMKTTVTTTKMSGETADEFAARHREQVNAMLRLFPKDA